MGADAMIELRVLWKKRGTGMDTVIDRYVETVLAPHLVGLGVASLPWALNIVVTDVRLRLQSVLVHWQNLPIRKTLLLIGREEGMFYQPQLTPLEIRALVVVAVRNSLLEDLGAAGSSLLPPDTPRAAWPVKDENIRSITQEAIVYWQQVDLEHLSLPALRPELDIFGRLKQNFPHAWHVLSRLAQTKTQTIFFPPCQTPLPTLLVPSVAAGTPGRAVVLSGINPLFDSQLVGFLRAVQDGEIDILFADSWKMLTRHPEKLFRILDFVLAYEGSVVTHNYLLTSTLSCARQGLLRPAHRSQEAIAKFQNRAGLTAAHRKALEEAHGF